jgi:DNA-binding transcriptional MerR regulator
LRREGLVSKDCMSFRCDLLDAALAEEVLAALQPAELELALAALQELEARDQAILRQWQMRLERAEYEAALAERRYQEVDPSQRLVAATLERRWNDALLQLEELKKQAAEFQRQEARVATSEQKAKVLALARDLPRLWHAPTTPAKDRKRMLRLLIKDITVEKPSARKLLVAHIRWQGGACSALHLQSLPNAEIAERLNREGHVSALGKSFTGSMIQWIRYRYQIPKVTLARPDELTVEQVAKCFGVSPNVVYYWIDRSVIRARRLNAGTPYWITLDEADEQKLRDWVHNSCRIHSASSTTLEKGAS